MNDEELSKAGYGKNKGKRKTNDAFGLGHCISEEKLSITKIKWTKVLAEPL